MKEVSMDITWRTVQVFLEDYGVIEVEVDQENPTKARCTCPGFERTARCKHVKHVKESMEENEGHYSIYIPVEVDEQEAFKAMSDPTLFRDFIIKYGKVAVID
jgi:transposase